MTRLIKLALCLALMSPFLKAQSFYSFPPFNKYPGAGFFVCGVPAAGNPCSNQVTVYADQGLLSPIKQPATIGADGNYGFWIPSATAQITIQIGDPYKISYVVGAGGGGGGGLSGMTAGQVPIAATATTVTSSKPLAGTDANILTGGTLGSPGLTLCVSSNGGAGTSGCIGSVGLPASGLVAEYRMPPTEVSTTTLTDYSGNGNNGTFPGGANNPTRLTNGGLSFASASNQYVALPFTTCTSFMFAYTYRLDNTFTGSLVQMPLLGQSALTGSSTVYMIGFHDQSNANVFTATKYRNMVTEMGGFPSPSTQWQGSASGSHVLIYASGTGQNDALYLDGLVNTYFVTGPATSSAGRFNPSPNVWWLGRNTPAFVPGAWNGNIYYAACWNRQITAAEAGQINNVVSNYLLQEGYTFPVYGNGTTTNLQPSSTGEDQFVFSGDSIENGAEDGNQGVPGWSSLLQLSTPTYTIWNGALVGKVLTADIAPNGYTLDGYFNNAAARNLFLEAGGHNDLSNTAPYIYGGMMYQNRNRVKAGWKFLIVSQIGSTTGVANREALDVLERQHWAENAVGLVDLGGDPTIGCDVSACTNTFQGPHPNIWENRAMMAYYHQRAINRIYGPQDFTNAPVYNSATAASATITASSDSATIGTSGMSTATYTFAANPFAAMGPAGNGLGVEVTCTGITPAGYNTTFWTLTSTATQITGIIPTTGLAAGSVFGTCSAPQSEDKYAIINFGAGNFTIGTACAYTGQRIYIKNINAAGSTIVSTPQPNEAAENFDVSGAATLTIAANSTRILESTVSGLPNAPQCSWRVIQ